MRIIPKKTKVAMEFFRGVEVPDVFVGIIDLYRHFRGVLQPALPDLDRRGRGGAVRRLRSAGGWGEGLHDALQLPEISGPLPAFSGEAGEKGGSPGRGYYPFYRGGWAVYRVQ